MGDHRPRLLNGVHAGLRAEHDQGCSYLTVRHHEFECRLLEMRAGSKSWRKLERMVPGEQPGKNQGLKTKASEA